MTISITRFDRRFRVVGSGGRSPAHLQQRAFTLAELLIGATLSTMVLAGVLSAFLMLGRSGVNAANYSESEAHIRRAIEDFSQDVRMASNVVWNSETSITLTVPDNYTTTANEVTYAWDSATVGTTAKCFYRKPGNASSGADKLVYVRNVASFTFMRYNRLDAVAANNAETKRIQFSMNVNRSGSTLVSANTALVSASYIIRNKAVN
jgi:Tfp pilus assembly protein PilW